MPRYNSKTPISLLSSRQRRRRRALILTSFSLNRNFCTKNSDLVSERVVVSNDVNSNDSVNDNSINPVPNSSPLLKPDFPIDFTNRSVTDLSTLSTSSNNNALCYFQTDETPSSSRNDKRENSLSNDLRQWLIEFNISHQAGNKLLSILGNHNIKNLPKDTRTLLKTPRSVQIIPVSPGHYVHFGIRVGLLNSLQKYFSEESPDIVYIDFNVDGLPISGSSSSQLWPILSAIARTSFYTEPFVIGIYHGYFKPKSSNDYLKLFVDDLKELSMSGIMFKNKNIKVVPNAFICDCPAKAFVACVKYHTGHSSCSKCIIEGDWYKNKVVFDEIYTTLRTDDSFLQRRDEDFHQGTSILEPFVGMVSQFAIDYMHAVCLGVVKKIMLLLVQGNVSVRLTKSQLDEVSLKLMSCKGNICCEFCRKPRSFDELCRWKATEFRQILLYTGPIIFKDVLKVEQYNHFMSLSVAIRILCSSDQYLYSYANNLLIYFVKNFDVFYGREHITHNVHNLLHLYNDVLKFGPLDNFSAFKYESKLYNIKMKVKKSSRPLQQISNRISEELSAFVQPIPHLYPYLEHSLENNDQEEFFARLRFKNFCLMTKPPDNLCLLNDGTMFEIIRIKKMLHRIQLYGNAYPANLQFFEKPINSLKLNISMINTYSTQTWIHMEDILKKCVKLPVGRSNDLFVVLPLVHL
ncbi:hypothetical protein PPYR_05647 [Photinus pyralis]|uniref:Transposase domain-containing protein n=1 Tax=Photinus pyralis TaxID=7054 RepID=A0A1Y1M871_PHOPY|nr:hypothetical protein PPYR_05647 [Photinus pyralis]